MLYYCIMSIVFILLYSCTIISFIFNIQIAFISYFLSVDAYTYNIYKKCYLFNRYVFISAQIGLIALATGNGLGHH